MARLQGTNYAADIGQDRYGEDIIHREIEARSLTKPTNQQVARGAPEDDFDEFDEWFEVQKQQDTRLAGSVADAACRSALLVHLVRRRQVSGLSQAAVAKAMETTQSAVSELEGGITDPRLSTLQRYARALNCALQVHVEPVYQHGYTPLSLALLKGGGVVDISSLTISNGVAPIYTPVRTLPQLGPSTSLRLDS